MTPTRAASSAIAAGDGTAPLSSQKIRPILTDHYLFVSACYAFVRILSKHIALQMAGLQIG
jgi:hypothetical protein